MHLYKDIRAISRGNLTNAVITELKKIEIPTKIRGIHPKDNQIPRGELSYLAPLGSENISTPYFKQRFFRRGVLPPQTESNTTPPSPKTEITNISFYILNFASIIKFKM